MTHARAAADAASIDWSRLPTLRGVERPFFDYWWREVIDPADPQKLRWVELEEHAVASNRAYVDRLADVMDLRDARVLDVGCQNGATMVALLERGAKPTGIEIVATSVEAARIRLRCHGMDADVRVGSACAMPFADEAFDAVLASNVTEHVPDLRALIRECARVLRPGGALYLDGPNRFSPRQFWSDPHYRLFGVAALPGPLAAAYVTRVRRFPRYDAETFPVASRVRSLLDAHGLDVVRPGPVRGVLGRVRSDLASMFHFVGVKRSTHSAS